jgi:hypothetical protein
MVGIKETSIPFDGNRRSFGIFFDVQYATWNVAGNRWILNETDYGT